ncbi:MAG: butyrate kinase [Fusobacteria bacterium]|nr:butyrate kinase [Fusobacteriota bacterium]
MKILAINPGSTSTKISVYENDKQLFVENITLDDKMLEKYPTIISQKELRKNQILNFVSEKGVSLSEIKAVVGRGGLVRHLTSGVYEINEQYIYDATIGLNGQHASNLGGILAFEIADEIGNGTKAFTVDPVVVDEMMPMAKLSGVPEITRLGSGHPLNHKAIARKYAKDRLKKYEDLNLIIAHIGGGITVAAHEKGKIIDQNAALDGDGPFSPERAGRVNPGALIRMCFSGKYSEKEVYEKIVGKGGVYAYLGTKDMRDVVAMMQKGDGKAKLIFEAMCYNISKDIAGCAVALKGKIDGIILTGGVSHGKMFCDQIQGLVSFLPGEFAVYAGEDEMESLSIGAYDAMTGDRTIKVYGAENFVGEK